MTPEEWAAAAAAAKAEYERETGELRRQIERTRAKLARLETQLAAKTGLHRAKMARLGDAVLGLPIEELPPPPTVLHVARKASRGRRMLEEPLLELARELALPEVTSRQILDVWNQRNPDNPISDSTVRSILDRLEARGALRMTAAGGGKGKGIPKRYAPAGAT
jgi:hypothetical protein